MEAKINNSIQKIHNYIYANEGLNNFEVLDELLKVIYCKYYDEKNENLLSSAKSEDDLFFIVNRLFEDLKKKHKNIFYQNETFTVNKRTLIYIFNELANINFSSLKVDIKGHILQLIIDRSFREGRGQFFTPAPIVEFATKMINPKENEIGCDIACGTGGFMFASLEHISKHKNITKDDVKNVYFYDISKTLSRLISMRLSFEFSISEPNIFIQDSLSSNFNKEFDYILSNPPFGSQGRISDSTILSKYVLGKDEKGKIFSSQVPDILFVEKIIQILKNGGRAAIILPDGNFENPSSDYVRKFIFETCKINAIISLPDGCFIPYGTGVKASIIFLTKDSSAHNDNYNIFFGKINKLGYTFSKHSKPIYLENGTIDEDYSDVLDCYINKKLNDFNYEISSDRIKENNYNFSYNKYCKAWENVVNKIQLGSFSKISDICEVVNKKVKILPEEQYRYVEIGDINTENCEIVNCSTLKGSEMPSRASYVLQENDILVAIAGNAIGTDYGAKAIVTKDYAGCICTNGFIVLRNTKISPYLLLDFFTTENFKIQVIQSKYGTAIPTISKEDFFNICLPRYSIKTEDYIKSTYKQAFDLKEQAKQLLKELKKHIRD